MIPVHPERLTEWVALCQTLDNRMRALKHRQSRGTTSNTTNTWRPTNTAPAPKPATTTASGAQAGPMDLTAGSARKTISEAERNQRVTQGLCFNCDEMGHFENSCSVPHPKIAW